MSTDAPAQPPPPSPADRVHELVRSNLASMDEQERRAREARREVEARMAQR
jgi:hypothetical protein